MGTTNKQIFGWDGLRCDPERVRFVRQTVRNRFNELLSGKLVADNINVFVKREPVTLAKESLGRYRLISGVSLTDNLVDRILFGWLLRVAVETATKTPSMVGWSPLRGGWRYIFRHFRGKPVVCLDKSSWDWTVVEWQVHAFTSFIKSLPINPPSWWTDMVDARMKLLYEIPTFEFQDGTVASQSGIGIQKSGSLLTILFNCVSQSLLHYRVMARLGYPLSYKEPKVLGDDTVQETPPELERYVQILESMGPKVKGVKIQHWVEFAGFAFLPKACVPAYWKKHLYNLRYTENPVETLRAYQILYAHDPAMFAYLERVLSRWGAGFVLARSWCKHVFDDPA